MLCTLCVLLCIHYDCFYICKDLTEGEINQSINVAQNYFLKTACPTVFIIKNCWVNAEHYASKHRFAFITFQIIQRLSLMSNQITIKLSKNEERGMGIICCARPGLVKGLGNNGTEKLCTFVRHL